jgi:RNA-directed DNA polymerase
MGMERRAERKDGGDTVTAAKARKPKGGADDCLATERSTPNTTWRQVKANHGAPGIDGMTVEDFPDFVRSPQWASVRKALEDGTYKPQPVRRVYIPKDSGGRRPLGIPPVLDRVIEQALAQVMEPLFDPEFSEFSYGFRKRRGTAGAGIPEAGLHGGGRP